jgi:hypothetical protein
LFDSSPWGRADGEAQDAKGEIPIRYTQKAENLFAFMLGIPTGPAVRLKNLRARESSVVRLLGNPEPLEWRQVENDLMVILEERLKSVSIPGNACGLVISPQPEAIDSED